MPCTPPSFPANPELKYLNIAAGTNGDNALIAAPAGKKKIIVLGYAITTDATGVVKFQNTAETPAVYATLEFAGEKGGSVAYAGGPWCPAFEVTAGTGLEINVAENVDASGHLVYVIA